MGRARERLLEEEVEEVEEDVALCPRAASFSVRTPEPWNLAQPRSRDRNGRRQAAPRSGDGLHRAVRRPPRLLAVNGLDALAVPCREGIGRTLCHSRRLPTLLGAHLGGGDPEVLKALVRWQRQGEDLNHYLGCALPLSVLKPDRARAGFGSKGVREISG